jgi:hypothetical protein
MKESKKGLLRAYKDYLSRIDPDYEAAPEDPTADQPAEMVAERGARGVKGQTGQGGAGRGGPFFAALRFNDNSCARDTMVVVFAAAELNGMEAVGGVCGGAIHALADGVREVGQKLPYG